MFECAALFGMVPFLIQQGVLPLRLMMPMLMLFGVGCFAWLWFDPAFDRSRLWNAAGARREARRILRTLAVGAGALLVVTLVVMPERFLGFPRQAPGFWLAVMLGYPLISAYPQEVIYRAFFFQRYREIFTTRWSMIVASAASFGWAHVIFETWMSVALTAVGGGLFAWTYTRSRSTLASAVEHGLYGDVAFTVGIGWIFYAGSVGVA